MISEALWFTHNRDGARFLCYLHDSRTWPWPMVVPVDLIQHDRLVDHMVAAAHYEIRLMAREAMADIDRTISHRGELNVV